MRLFRRKKVGDEAMSTPRETRRRWRRFFRVIVIIFALLLLVRLVSGWWVGRGLSSAVKALEESGQPVRIGDITPPMVPAADDAWPIYKSLLAKAEDVGFGQDADDETREALRAEYETLHEWLTDLPARAAGAEGIARMVETHSELLDLLAQAAAKPAIGWRLTDDPLAPLDANVVPVAWLADLMVARAVIRFDAGRTEEGLADVGVVALLGLHLAQLPFHEARYLEPQVLHRVRKVLEEMLGSIDATPAQLGELRGRLAGGARRPILQESVLLFRAIRRTIHEQTVNYEINPDPQAGGARDVSWTTCVKIWAFRPFIDASHTHGLRLFEEVIPLMDAPYPELAEPLATIRDRIGEDSQGFTGSTRRRAYEYAAIALWTAERMAVAEAIRRMAALAVAIRVYQQDHDGQSPETLDQLVPGNIEALPVDPMTGEAFGYLPAAEPPRVYSVGLDRIDNGGAGNTEEDPWGLEGHDIAFHLPRRPAPAATRPATRPASRPATMPADSGR